MIWTKIWVSQFVKTIVGEIHESPAKAPLCKGGWHIVTGGLLILALTHSERSYTSIQFFNTIVHVCNNSKKYFLNSKNICEIIHPCAYPCAYVHTHIMLAHARPRSCIHDVWKISLFLDIMASRIINMQKHRINPDVYAKPKSDIWRHFSTLNNQNMWII